MKKKKPAKKKAAKKPVKKKKLYRSAETGRMVTKDFSETNPKTTVTEKY